MFHFSTAIHWKLDLYFAVCGALRICYSTQHNSILAPVMVFSFLITVHGE